MALYSPTFTTCRGVAGRLVIGLAFVGLLACGSKTPTAPTQNNPNPNPNPQTPTVTSVSVTSSRNTITVGQTEQFSATANMSNNTTQSVSGTATWTSTNTGVATVSTTGLVTGVAAGTAEIRAAFGGSTGTASLQVNAPAPTPPVAMFSVSGPGGANTCRIIPASGGRLDCTFDGSASTGGTGGAVTRWIWRFDVGANSGGPISDDQPTLQPNPGCGFFVDKPVPSGGATFIQMIVKLVVRNAANVESQELRNNNVRLFPQNQCGFGF